MYIQSKRIVFPNHIASGIIEVVEDNIVAILPYGSVRDVIDVGDDYVVPGLVDMHNHGYAGWAFTGTSSEEDLRNLLKRYLAEGVTGLLATSAPKAYPMIRRIIENPSTGAELLGIHSEGPFINPLQYGAAPPDTPFPSPDVTDMSKRVHAASQLIKVVTLAPEVSGNDAVIEYLNEQNIRVAAGHTNATFTQLQDIGDKLSLMTHLGNAMSGLHHREIGAFGFGLHEPIWVELIADGNHISKHMLGLIFQIKSKEKIILVSDTIALGGCMKGEYPLASGTVWLDDTGTLVNEYGRMSGSSHTLLYDVRYLHNNLNLELTDLFKMASLNPAIFLGVDDRIGSIEVGKQADLLILDHDLNIKDVVKKGVIIQALSSYKELSNESVMTLMSDKEFMNFYAIMEDEK